MISGMMKSHNLSCRALFWLLGVCLLSFGCKQNQTHWDNEESKLQDEDFCAIWPDFHAVMVVSEQDIIFERYCSGHDWRLSESLGTVSFASDTNHDVRSISKTVTALLIGIALDQGQIKHLDQTLHELLPAYSKYLAGEKASLTLRHALTMTAGLAWDEDSLPYSDVMNDERQMSKSPDPTAHVLRRSLASVPGQVFNYNGGMTQVLAAVLEHATSMPLDVFAHENLFAPLGIADWEWQATGNASPSAYAGLRLSTSSLAKLARLVLQQGRWQDNTIVSNQWVEQMLATQVSYEDQTAPDFVLSHGYGYQLWTNTMQLFDETIQVFTAVGNGGQRVIWYPDKGIAVVVLAGLYNQPSMEWQPEMMVKQWLIPEVVQPYLLNY